MTYNSSQQFESYIPVYDAIPEDWENSRDFIVEMLRKISDGINNREIGFYLDEELLSGKSFIAGIDQPHQYRSVFRKVIDFGDLPNAGTKSVDHGINFDSRFTLINMYAGATDPVAFSAFPVTFPAAGFSNGVQLYMDSTKVYITTQSNRSAYTRCYVVIEYLLEV